MHCLKSISPKQLKPIAASLSVKLAGIAYYFHEHTYKYDTNWISLPQQLDNPPLLAQRTLLAMYGCSFVGYCRECNLWILLPSSNWWEFQGLKSNFNSFNSWLNRLSWLKSIFFFFLLPIWHQLCVCHVLFLTHIAEFWATAQYWVPAKYVWGDFCISMYKMTCN